MTSRWAPTLTGELVVLRPLRAEDAEPLWEMHSDPEGRRLAGETVRLDRAELERRCAEGAREGEVVLAITTEESPEALGEVSLRDVDMEDAHATFRMSLRPGHRGRGLGGEAIGLVLDHAFTPAPDGLALHRVDLQVLEINPRARMLYENHGFVAEGVLREVHRDGDFWVDAVAMSILEDDDRPSRR